MVTLIIYDIKAGKNYNRIKRNFYYHLKKFNITFLNKSVMEVPDQHLEDVLSLLKKHSKHIEAYVIEASSIDRI